MSGVSTDGRLSYQRRFPALQLLHVPGIGLAPTSVVIAGLASALLYLGCWIVNLAIGTSPTSIEISGSDPAISGSSVAVAPVGIFSNPVFSVNHPVLGVLLSPDSAFLRFSTILKIAIAIAVWSFAGGILCRRAAYRFAGNDEKTLVDVIDYSVKRWLAAIGSPLIPLSLALLLALFVMVFGFICRVPYLGSFGLFVSSPFLLIAGFVMGFLLLATLLSWPLMVAAVAVDDCDSFGGLSRAYSGLTGRPWHFISYVLICLLMGRIVMGLFNVFEEFSVHFLLSSLQMGSGEDLIRDSLLYPLNGLIDFLKWGIEASYFWSAATVTYLLIRLEVDGVPLQKVAPDDFDRPVRDPLPVVGIPATDLWTGSNGSASSGNHSDVI